MLCIVYKKGWEKNNLAYHTIRFKVESCLDDVLGDLEDQPTASIFFFIFIFKYKNKAKLIIEIILITKKKKLREEKIVVCEGSVEILMKSFSI